MRVRVKSRTKGETRHDDGERVGVGTEQTKVKDLDESMTKLERLKPELDCCLCGCLGSSYI